MTTRGNVPSLEERASNHCIGNAGSILCSPRVRPRSVHLSRERLRRRGAAAVWVALLAMVMICFVGLSLDTAKVALVLHEMQNASDAAALAGANIVRVDRAAARLRAQTIAQQNFAERAPVLLDLNANNDPNGDIVVGWYNSTLQTFTPSAIADAVNAMAVITTRSLARNDVGTPVSLMFGSIAGVTSVDVGGDWQQRGRPYAIAMCAGGTGAGLIALKDTLTEPEPGLDVQGTTEVSVVPLIPPALPGDGEIQINSPLDNAFHTDGGPTITASALNVTGGVDIGNYDLTVPYNSPAPPIPDPLEWLQPPAYDPATDLTAQTRVMVGDNNPWPRIDITDPDYDENGNPVPWELFPGYYSEGFYINSAGTLENPTVHFNPGVYIIGGSAGEGNAKEAGLVVTAQSYVVSDEATFYITSNADGSDYGTVHIHAGAGFKASEPPFGVGNYYEGITIFQDRANTNAATIYGSGNLDLEGTLYFPKADPVYLRGGGNGFGNQLIGWRFDIGGNGIIGIEYDGRNRAPVTRSFLVE